MGRGIAAQPRAGARTLRRRRSRGPPQRLRARRVSRLRPARSRSLRAARIRGGRRHRELPGGKRCPLVPQGPVSALRPGVPGTYLKPFQRRRIVSERGSRPAIAGIPPDQTPSAGNCERHNQWTDCDCACGSSVPPARRPPPSDALGGPRIFGCASRQTRFSSPTSTLPANQTRPAMRGKRASSQKRIGGPTTATDLSPFQPSTTPRSAFAGERLTRVSRGPRAVTPAI